MNNPQNNTKLPHYDPENNNKSSKDKYLQTRKDHLYYDFIRSLLMTICRKEDSICDVGSRGVDMLSFLPCKIKKSIDLQYPYSDDETEGIKGDYLEHDLSGIDIITCFQVLEHVKDDRWNFSLINCWMMPGSPLSRFHICGLKAYVSIMYRIL